MITTNPAWDSKNAQLAKKPIYVFAISGLDRVYTTHDLTREGITGTLPESRAWLKVPRGASQSIDVTNGSSSIGELECEVIEHAGQVRELQASTVLEGRTVTLSVGYPGIAYTEFVPLHVYRLYKVVPSKDYTGWMFRSRDQQMSLKRTIRVHPENGEPISEENPWIFDGTPSEIIQAVHLFALGRSVEELDLTGLRALDSPSEGLYCAARPFLFQLTEAAEAKQFLESEVYRICGMYPVVTHTGQLSVRAHRAPAAGAVPVFTFDQNNICVLPEVDRADIVNEIVYQYDSDGSEFGTQRVFVDGDSISTYGRAKQLRLESKGLRTALGADWFTQNVATRMFRRFGGVTELRGGAARIRVEAFLLSLPVWVGDYVLVTHPLMPDLVTGGLGVTDRLYEVVDREPDYQRGRMRYRLLDTGLTGLQAAYGWAPCARPFVLGTSGVY